jgi:hypothetical protein
MRSRSRRPERALLLVTAVALAACGSDDDAPADEPIEARRTYAVSHILFVRERHPTREEALRLADQALEALRKGAGFAEVARARSEEPGAKETGGFLGFLDASHDTAFHGAIQAARPGETVGPIQTPLGVHLIRRHGFEEARRLERELFVPVYGFAIPFGPGTPGARTKDEALSAAREAIESVRAGRLTMPQARERYGEVPQGPEARADALLGVMARKPGREPLYDAVADLPDGGVAPPVEGNDRVFVVQRGRMLRAIVRHILVKHIQSTERELSVRRTPAEARARAQQALDAVRGGERWEDVVARTSDELDTARTGGSLGTVGTGVLHPALEEAVQRTEPGKYASDVVETPAGFHVVWRVK